MASRMVEHPGAILSTTTAISIFFILLSGFGFASSYDWYNPYDWKVPRDLQPLF